MNTRGRVGRHGERMERRNTWDTLKDGNQRNARQAEGEEGSEQWQDEWRAAGVVAGQASCGGRSPERRRAEAWRGREARAKGRFRGVGKEAKWDWGIQDDKTEKNARARSVKESEMRCQSLHAAVAGESLISLLISQHASWSTRQAERLGLDGTRREEAELAARSVYQPFNK